MGLSNKVLKLYKKSYGIAGISGAYVAHECHHGIGLGVGFMLVCLGEDSKLLCATLSSGSSSVSARVDGYTEEDKRLKEL